MLGETLARPSHTDQPISFARNEATFPWKEIPQDYPFAERFDGVVNGVPRASYFKLSPETVGQPIAERVADSLQRTFQFEVKNGREGRDKNFAKMQLGWAQTSEEEGNWSAAVSHAAEAFSTGRSRDKRQALKVLGRVFKSVRNHKDFAPAKNINVLNTSIGKMTIPASIQSIDDYRHLKWDVVKLG